MDKDQPITLRVAARQTRYSYKGLWAHVAKGHIEAYRSGSTWLVTLAAIEEAEKDGRIGQRRTYWQNKAKGKQ